MPRAKVAETVKREPVNLLPLCGCEGCQPLEAEFKDDPVMLSFLKRTLLKRGWTGTATPAEKAYQRAHSTWAAGLAERGAALGAQVAEFHEKSKAERPLLSETLEIPVRVPEQGVLL